MDTAKINTPIHGEFPGTLPKIIALPPKIPSNKKIQAAIFTTALDILKNPKCSRINSPQQLVNTGRSDKAGCNQLVDTEP